MSDDYRESTRRLFVRLKSEGRTLVPLEMYFNTRGLVKITVGLCVGRRKHDKRQAMAERDARREIDRASKP